MMVTPLHKLVGVRGRQSTVTFLTTALSCEATKEYSPCVAPCGQTCQDLAGPEACGVDGGSDLSGDECVEGCACPPDTYLDTQADLCVPR